MRYVDNLATIDPVVGTVGTYSYRANDIFDPNLTGVGHQPYGHDTLALVYGRYKVLSSKITVRYYAGGTGGVYSGLGSIQTSTETIATTNPTLMLEQPETTYGPIASLQSNKGVTTLSKTYNAARFFGKKRNHELTANMGAGPTEKAYFHIGVQGTTSTSDVPRYDLAVTITYKVLLTEPIALGQS